MSNASAESLCLQMDASHNDRSLYSCISSSTLVGCKVIVVLRDPMDVVVSFFHFFENWFFPSGEVELDEFAEEFWLARGVPASIQNNASYFVHLTSWYKHRNDPNVLIVCFEDLKEDLEKQVRRVAEFMSTDNVSLGCCDLSFSVSIGPPYTFSVALSCF